MIKSMLGLPQASRSVRRTLSSLLATSLLLGTALPAMAATPSGFGALTDKTIGNDRPKLISNPTLLTLTMANADVRATLEMMGKKGGMNLIIDESVTGSISLALKAVPLDEAFNLVLKMKNLIARRMGTTLLIASEEVFRTKGFSGTQTILLRFDNAKIADVEIIFKQALSEQPSGAGAAPSGGAPAPGAGAQAGSPGTDPNIKIIKDERTNSLLVTAPEEMIDRARALKALLDVPTPQVEIEVKMLETTETGSRQLGVNYGFGGSKFGAGFNNPNPDGTAGGAGNQAGNPSTGQGGMSMTYNALGNFTANFNARIDALVQNGLAKVMANPKVVAQDNKQATITITNKIPYTKVTSNDRVVVTSQEFIDVSQTLQITPRVDTAGFVTLELNPTVSVAGTAAPGNLPPVDTRTVQTTMRVRDNESIVIGGLKRTTQIQSTTKIPILGDLPLLGALFRRNTSDEIQTDIVLIVTPRIQTRLSSTEEVNTDSRGGGNPGFGGSEPSSGPPKF